MNGECFKIYRIIPHPQIGAGILPGGVHRKPAAYAAVPEAELKGLHICFLVFFLPLEGIAVLPICQRTPGHGHAVGVIVCLAGQRYGIAAVLGYHRAYVSEMVCQSIKVRAAGALVHPQPAAAVDGKTLWFYNPVGSPP